MHDILVQRVAWDWVLARDSVSSVLPHPAHTREPNEKHELISMR